MLHAVWRYGVWSLYNLKTSLGDMLKDYKNIYTIQNDGHSFTTVHQMLDAVGEGMWEYTQHTAQVAMQKNGTSLIIVGHAPSPLPASVAR